MGVGRDLGRQLRQWRAMDPSGVLQSRALSNRLIDALGAEETFKGPIRDLASQPLLLQALASTGTTQRTALDGLSEQLERTYSPAVLAELLDLLETATGIALPRPSQQTQRPSASDPQGIRETEQDLEAAQQARARPSLPSSLRSFGPGLAMAACGALVLSWATHELDRGVLEGWGWSGGVVLVLLLGLCQALALGPLKRLRSRWPLQSEHASEPDQAWRWISQAWIHRNTAEAAVNLVLLLILLGNSPLQLGDVVMRYCLTSLACVSLAALMATRFQVFRSWSGASGPISALIALAAGLSLLHWRVLPFSNGILSIPAWVLLLVYGALQLRWQLPRQAPDETSRPWHRLLSSPWLWGLLLGFGWALISWTRELIATNL